MRNNSGETELFIHRDVYSTLYFLYDSFAYAASVPSFMGTKCILAYFSPQLLFSESQRGLISSRLVVILLLQNVNIKKNVSKKDFATVLRQKAIPSLSHSIQLY